MKRKRVTDNRSRLAKDISIILLTLLLATVIFIGKALALSTGTLHSNGLTTPVSALWLPGSLGGHLWVSDAVLGFCRLDTAPDSIIAQPNLATCFKVGGGTAGQAAFDVNTNSVYVADASANSQGAYRLTYDPVTETVGSPLLLASGQILDAGGVRAAALAPDGKLYLGLGKNGQIVRLTDPSGPSQTLEAVGATSNGLASLSFAFIGNDLYVAETLRVTRIVGAAACLTGSCNPTEATGIDTLAPTALLYDGTNNLFVADFFSVDTFNPNDGTQARYATAGLINGASVLFGGVSGLGIDLQGNLLVGDNFSGAALAGKIWTVIPGTTPPDLPEVDIVQPLASLKTVPVPEPSNLMDFVSDKQAAIQLGKALFWDVQVGSDGKTACASCHFHAGADVRTKNQINPGLRGDDSTFQLAGPNYQLQPADFPLTKHADSNAANSPIVSDVNDIISSQGVFLHNFSRVKGDPVDKCVSIFDSVFNVGGVNVRRVAPRNAPSTINAVFNFRNFWDGRASNIFNGVNPFGLRDNITGAGIWKYNGTAIVLTPIAIDNASLASQAVGPPGSSFEMSCDVRALTDIGRKLLNTKLRPLGQQLVDPNDSVLGSIAASRGKNPSNGLTVTYRDLIQKAFRSEYWSDTKVGDLKYSQMESNFSLFFGLSIQLYESTLVADNTPFDQFMEGNTEALTPSQQMGLSVFAGQGRCIGCHSGPELTKASVNSVTIERLERMIMGDGGCAVYDNGFYNIGVRPSVEDIGLGGTDPFGNPLSDSGMAQLGRFTDPNLQTPFGMFPTCDSRINVTGTFKTPGLRNVELTGPYFHNGGQATLWQVVDFYNRGGDFGQQNIANLDPLIGNLQLTDGQKTDLVNFLLSLTDERVRWEKAPFDHPALCIPNGQQGDTVKVTETKKGSGEAADVMLCLPAIGAGGNNAPLLPFLNLSPFDR